ncbi:MAG: hypothetical protein WD749_05010 [Phycisphaerales bacterium]
MRCLSCGYTLAGVTSGRCPECGRGFDAADPETFDQPGPSAGRRRERRWLNRAVALCMLPAPLSYALLFSCWFLGSVTLGRAPRPSIDDPGRVPLVPLLSSLWMFATMAAMAFAPGFLILTATVWFMPGTAAEERRSRTLCVISGVTLACSIAAFFLLRNSAIIQWLFFD